MSASPLTALHLDVVAGDQLDLLGVLGRHCDDVVMGTGGCGKGDKLMRLILWCGCDMLLFARVESIRSF